MSVLARSLKSHKAGRRARTTVTKEIDVPIPGSDSATASSQAPASNDEDFLGLHAERASLERSLTLAQARQRFGTNAADMEEAREEEGRLLVTLDRVLTQIRAAEYRRKPGARRW